jgi:hypothetical protein
VAVYQVYHTGGYAGLFAGFYEVDSGKRNVLAGFDNNRITAHECGN